MHFCSLFHLTPFPADSHTLQLFVGFLARSVSYKTIKVYLAAVRHAHLIKGLSEPPADHLLHYALRGIRRTHGDSKRTRLPITLPILKRLKRQLHNTHLPLLDKRMLWAAFCTAFYGFLRASEFTSQPSRTPNPNQTLLRSDVRQQGLSFELTLKSSKTDPFHRGCTIILSRTGTSTCPVSALSKIPGPCIHPST